MRSLEQIRKELSELEEILGFDPHQVQQGSEAWLSMRLGVITASRAESLLAKKGTASRDGYMAELIAEICTGQSPEISAKPLEWGKENEDGARALYELQTDAQIVEVPFVYKDSKMRVGCSPDGFTSDRGVEKKCPMTTRYHIEFLTDEKIKPEYIKQVQFSMWVTDADKWDFGSFDPRMKFKKFAFKTVERDEKMMTKFDEAVAEFTEEMDAKLAKLGVKFGDQWQRPKKVQVA